MPRSPLRLHGDDIDERVPLLQGDVRTPIHPSAHQSGWGDIRRGWALGTAQVSAGNLFNEAVQLEARGDPEFRNYRDRGLRMLEYAQQGAPRVNDLRQIHGLGDAVDYAQSATGQMAATMLPAVGGAILGRGLTRSNIGGMAGAFIPSYMMERDQSYADQYQDPALAEAPISDRMDAARARGVVAGALNTVVPAGAAATIFRQPAKGAMGRIGRDAAVEAVTETAQEGTGYAARRYLDPNQQLDPWELANAAVMGAIGGGAIRGGAEAFSHGSDQLGTFLQARQQRRMEEAAKPTPEPKGPPPPPRGEDGGIDLKAYADYTRQQRESTVENVSQAGEKATSAAEFIDLAFFRSPDVQAEAVLRPEADPIFGKLSDPEVMAELDARDILNTVTVQKMANELITDPRTPETTKTAVKDMAGSFDFPDTQMSIAQMYAQVKRNQSLQDKLDALQGTIKKSNLQRIPDADVANLAGRIAPLLGGNPEQAPVIARQLLALSARTPTPEKTTGAEAKLMEGKLSDLKDLGFATKDGRVPVSTIETLMGLDRALMEFDVDGAITQTMQESADRFGLISALAAIRNLNSAYRDVVLNDKNSFLYSMLTEDAKGAVTPAVMKQIAQVLDDNFDVLRMAQPEQDRVLGPMAKHLFGDEKRAGLVVEHYGALRRAAMNVEAASDLLADDRPTGPSMYGTAIAGRQERDVASDQEGDVDTPAYTEEGPEVSRGERMQLLDQNLDESSDPASNYYFAQTYMTGRGEQARSVVRPFLAADKATLSDGKQVSKARAHADRIKGTAGGPASVRVITMAQYAKDTKKDPLQLVDDLRQDIEIRNRRHADPVLQGQLVMLEGVTTPEQALRVLENYEVVEASNRTGTDGLVVTDDVLAEMTEGVDNKAPLVKRILEAGLSKEDGGVRWQRYPGRTQTSIEVSTQGDAFGKQFSAFNAKLADGRTIEFAYQVGVKGHASIKDGKGKPPVNKMTPKQTWEAYVKLWRQWAKENPTLMDELRARAQAGDGVLTDKFANTDINQARALAQILSEKAAERMIRRGTITFSRANKNPIQLSARAMWQVMSRQPGRDPGRKENVPTPEYVRQMFKEALAGVLVREDITGIKTLPAGTLEKVILEFPGGKQGKKPLEVGQFSWIGELRKLRQRLSSYENTAELEQLNEVLAQETKNLAQYRKKLNKFLALMEETAPVEDRTRAPLSAETKKGFQDRTRPEGSLPLDRMAWRALLPRDPDPSGTSDIEVSPRRPSNLSQRRDAEWRADMREFVQQAFQDMFADLAIKKFAADSIAEKASIERHFAALRQAQNKANELGFEAYVEEKQTPGFPETDGESTKPRRVEEDGSQIGKRILPKKASTLAEMRDLYKKAYEQGASEADLERLAERGKRAVSTAAQNLNAKTRDKVRAQLASLEEAISKAYEGSALPDTDKYEAMAKQIRNLRRQLEALTPVGESKVAPGITITADTSASYGPRTAKNAAAAPVTMAFAADFTTGGEKQTARVAGQRLVAFEGDLESRTAYKQFAKRIADKLKADPNGGRALNVAGNGIYTWAKHGWTQDRVNKAIFHILQQVKEQHPGLTRIVTGGQTGTDIAGAIAGAALGLDVRVHMPKGLLYRDKTGTDRSFKSAAEVKDLIQKRANELLTGAEPEPRVHRGVAMKYRDGFPAGHEMRPEFKGKSTFQLILDGKRTATTRHQRPNYAVGDIVEFVDGKGNTVEVVVTKAPYRATEVTAEQWSQLEGWAPSVYPGYRTAWQFQYRLKTAPKKPVPSATEAVEAGRTVRTADPAKQAELQARGHQETAPNRFSPPDADSPRLSSTQLWQLYNIHVKADISSLKTDADWKAYQKMVPLAVAQIESKPESLRSQNEKQLLAALKPERIVKSNKQAKQIHQELGKAGIPAAHNSPYLFSAFNWRKHFLSGEGAAAYGAGLYLSTSDYVAAGYKKQFTARAIDPTAPISKQGVSPTYHVSINADMNTELFSWDRPVTEMSEAVRKKLVAALKEFGLDGMLTDPFEASMTDGQTVYNMILGQIRDRSIGKKEAELEAAKKASTDAEERFYGSFTVETVQELFDALIENADRAETGSNALKWNKERFRVELKEAKDAGKSVFQDKYIRASINKLMDQYAPLFPADPASRLFTESRKLQEAVQKLEARMENEGMLETSDLLQKHGFVGHYMAANQNIGTPDFDNPNFVIYDDSRIEQNYVMFSKQAPQHKGRPKGPQRTTAQWRDEYKKQDKIHQDLLGKVRVVAAKMNAAQTAQNGAEWQRLSQELSQLNKDISASQKALDAIRKKGQQSKTQRWAWQDLMDELITLRGPDIQLRVDQTFGQLGGQSGQYSTDAAFTQRLIEVAINAGDPAQIRSVAMHESVHDLFQYLLQHPTEGSRKLMAAIQKAADSPHVIRQLRERLAGDKPALDQLADREERAAYMFQFWVSDPTFRITPATRNIFQKLVQLIREVLGIVSKYEKAEILLMQYQAGKFAIPALQNGDVRARDRAHQQQLLEQYNLTAETAREKLERLTPWLVKGYDVVLTDAVTRLRRFNYEPLNELADKFYRHISEGEMGEMGLLQARHQMEYKYLNMLYPIVDGLSSAEQKALQYELNTGIIGPQHAKAQQVHKLLDEIHAYLTENKVQRVKEITKDGTKIWEPIPYRKNFYHRKWDPSKIRADEEHFRTLLMDIGYNRADAEAITDGLIAGDGRIDLAETERHLGYVPFAAGIEARRLTKIGVHNADKFVEFMSDDVIDTMSTYIRQIVHRAEYAPRFGNDGEKIRDMLAASPFTDAEQRTIHREIQALEGTLGHSLSYRYKSLMGMAITTQNVLLLPLAVFSMAVDPMGIALRTGKWADAGNAYLNAMKDLKKAITRDKSRDWSREMADFIGVTSRTSMLEAYGQVQGSMYMTRSFRRANQLFFKWNGMEGLTNSYRVSALEAGNRWIKENLNNEQAMQEIGLDPKHVFVKADGHIAVTPGEIYAEIISKHPTTTSAKATKQADEASLAVGKAFFRFVDSAVVRPNAGHRPSWMSDPRFILIAHLKQFITSFQAIILQRVNKETLINGKTAPAAMLMTYMPIMLATDITKWFLTPAATALPAHWGWADYVSHAVTRAGILGKGEFGVDIVGDLRRGDLPGASLIGPTAEHAVELAQWVAGDPRTSTGEVVERTVPFVKYFF